MRTIGGGLTNRCSRTFRLCQRYLSVGPGNKRTLFSLKLFCRKLKSSTRYTSCLGGTVHSTPSGVCCGRTLTSFCLHGHSVRQTTPILRSVMHYGTAHSSILTRLIDVCVDKRGCHRTVRTLSQVRALRKGGASITLRGFGLCHRLSRRSGTFNRLRDLTGSGPGSLACHMLVNSRCLLIKGPRHT